MRDYEAVVAEARVLLANGARLQDLVSALLDQLSEDDCPPDDRLRLQAAADQLGAALRQLRASTGKGEPGRQQ